MNNRYRLRSREGKKSHIPTRLNVLFLIVFLAFALLFIRLGYLQLYQGEDYANMVQKTQSTLSTGAVPRGMMYDRNGNVLVGNKPELAILYTRERDSKVSQKDIIDTATQLASLIDLPTSDVTERDRKDYFIVKNKDLVNSRLSKEEKNLPGSEVYKVQLEKVTPEDIDFNDAELKTVALFKKMNSAYALSTVTVKSKNVTQAEIARVSERLGDLPGISIGTDWQRTYPQEEMLRSIFGQVSTEQRGLPKETAEALQKKGYVMNDRVGINFLEKQYENTLSGTKSQYNIVTDSDDDILENEMLYEGSKGSNLVLSIDMNLQKKLDEIAENALKNMEQQGLNDRIYITAIDPRNGDVLALSGKKFAYDKASDSYDYDTIVDDAAGAINTSYGMGSTVKPAMVATGYMEGVITLDDNVIIDEPLKFQASQEKKSHFNKGEKIPLSDIQALQQSSNTYPIKLAMRIGGQPTYEPDGLLKIKPETIDIIRSHFGEFGLGAPTGIDLPSESTGYSPESDQLVSTIDLSFGQFDLYTPLQLGQHSATIASRGIRYAPRLVREIRGTDANGDLGAVEATIPSKVMNVVPIDQRAMDRIHEGMRQVSHTDLGSASYYFKNYPIEVGSKTGTTEAFYSGPIKYAQNQPVTNATYIGFAPYDDPEIAISIVVPYLNPASWGRQSSTVAYEVMNAYFSLKSDTKPLIEKYMKDFQLSQ